MDKEKPFVSDIAISGASFLSNKKIKSVMLTKKKGLAFWKEALFNRQILDGDIGRIRKLYESVGFYDAQVELAVIPDTSGKSVSLHLSVKEGEPMRIASLSIDVPFQPAWFADAVGFERRWGEDRREEDIYTNLPLTKGDIFDSTTYGQTKKILAALFADHGYARAKVEGQAKIYKQEHQADLVFTVMPGGIYHVADIEIQGETTVDPRIIRREMAVRPGELYSLSRIKEDEQKLYRLDLFRFVAITPVWPDKEMPVIEEDLSSATETLELPSYDEVTLLVAVEEKPARGVKIGAGYGTEDKGRLRAELRWRNFLRQGYSFKFAGKYSSIIKTLESQFTNPYFFGQKGLALTYNLGYEQEDVESFVNTRYFSKVMLSKAWTWGLTLSAAQLVETNKTEELPSTVEKKAIERYGGKEEEDFLLSSLEFGGRWSTVDNDAGREEGLELSYFVEPASSLLGSEIDFMRHVFELKGYQPVVKNGVAALRLTLGTVDPVQGEENIPISKRFFCGGSNSVRGYPYQDVGEKDEFGNPVGGYSLLEVSLEYRFPVVGDLGGVFFADAGNVFTESFEFSEGELRHSVGFGLRYQTVVGPIRFDVGYQLNPQDPNDERYRLHLSFGEAF